MIRNWYNVNICCEVLIFTISQAVSIGKIQTTAPEDIQSELLEITLSPPILLRPWSGKTTKQI